jgi:fructokinase
MNRKIYHVGEAVLDILFREGESFTSKAGGASLNAAVSLGRLNLPVHFISEYGLDEVGNIIDKFLRDNQVSTKFVYRYYDGQSPLALAFLNENMDASYNFYKIYPDKRLDIRFPEINEGDIILFGSFYAITTAVRDKLVEFLKLAKKQKAIIIYDPNFRKQHLHELHKLKPMIMENIALADIVRGSNEDFSFILGAHNADEVYQEVGKDKVLLYTASHKGVYLKTPAITGRYPVNKIDPKSTIGAGDNFNAGIVYSLYNKGIDKKGLLKVEETQWEDIIHTCVEFATNVCLRYENYLSKEFALNYRLD